LNIHRTPYSGRNFEYYSEDSFLSGETCSYETIGAQSKGAFIMVKHFVANDSESQRHGNNEWMTEQTLRELYLRAFEKEFTEGGAWATMTSYNRLGTEWAGGCYNLLTNVLRKEWGFEGFCSSDYTNGTGTPYMNAYTGIQAGCDTYDSNYHKSVYDGLQNNRVFQYCLRKSSKYISNAIVHTAVMNGITPSTRVIIINTWWQNALIGAQIGFGALTAIFFVLFVFSWIKNRNNQEEQKK
jgi:beta-glucosidase